jgi:hypothetical protein
MLRTVPRDPFLLPRPQRERRGSMGEAVERKTQRALGCFRHEWSFEIAVLRVRDKSQREPPRSANEDLPWPPQRSPELRSEMMGCSPSGAARNRSM